VTENGQPAERVDIDTNRKLVHFFFHGTRASVSCRGSRRRGDHFCAGWNLIEHMTQTAARPIYCTSVVLRWQRRSQDGICGALAGDRRVCRGLSSVGGLELCPACHVRVRIKGGVFGRFTKASVSVHGRWCYDPCPPIWWVRRDLIDMMLTGEI